MSSRPAARFTQLASLGVLLRLRLLLGLQRLLLLVGEQAHLLLVDLLIQLAASGIQVLEALLLVVGQFEGGVNGLLNFLALLAVVDSLLAGFGGCLGSFRSDDGAGLFAEIGQL